MEQDHQKKRPHKKRGQKKRGKKQKETDLSNQENGANEWHQDGSQEKHFQAAHYGEVSEELLGYFKNVETGLDDPQFESKEDQRLFVENVLNEVDGNELRLSTNYSCSLILEKLLKVSDAFQLRVFADKLSGRSVELFAHRFASHVCQTLLTLAANVVEDEVKSGVEKMEVEGDDKGELLTMEQLVLNIAQDIKPVIGGLISQQFASHVIRVLFYVLAGKRVDESNDLKGRFRSKKSAKYKTENNDTLSKASGGASETRLVPNSFKNMLRELTDELSRSTSQADMRALAVHPVANPAIQLLLEIQGDDEEGQKTKTAFLDRILWGMATDVDSTVENKDRDAWFQTMVRDPVGSHLLEVIIKVAPEKVYTKMLNTYFANKLEKFGLHPSANFVVQHLITNARTPSQLKIMVNELKGSFEKLIKNGKHGVIRSLVEASANLNAYQGEVMQALEEALHLKEKEDKKQFVNCVMRMWTLEEWREAPTENKLGSRGIQIHGSLILQNIMKMPAEYNSIVMTSFFSQDTKATFAWCFSPIASRAYEAIISSPHVNKKMKKKILHDLLGSYVQLAKDKFGSHIIERCWEVADVETKEKIAKELVKREHELSEHYIGKCILWTCRIDEFKRRHDDWVEREKGYEKRKDLFKDILEEANEAKMKKKKRKA